LLFSFGSSDLRLAMGCKMNGFGLADIKKERGNDEPPTTHYETTWVEVGVSVSYEEELWGVIRKFLKEKGEQK
jgi:hypothetical protein